MYERFTDRARKVYQFANQEAHRFNHEYIGTEHIILGLVKEGNGIASNVLKSFGVDLAKVRAEVEKLLQSGPEMITMGKLPQTQRAQKVTRFAMEEARNLNHKYVGTEHVLLGLLREQEGIAAQVLENLGVKFEQARARTLELLGFSESDASQPEESIESLVEKAAKQALQIAGILGAGAAMAYFASGKDVVCVRVSLNEACPTCGKAKG